MNSLLRKAGVGIATGALIAFAAVPAAFADTGVGVGGNGAFSSNDVNVSNNCSSNVSQSNNTDITNNIRNLAATGGNGASFNTGGSVAIYSGGATSNTNISNAAGSNVLSGVGGCGYGGSTTGVSLTGNGAFSSTNVDVSNQNREQYRQSSETQYLNNVYNSMTSGNNYAGFNTGTDVVIYTGGANSSSMLWNQAGSNMLH